MKILMTALGLTALASQATALSCLRPDPINTFKQVAEAPEDYFVLYGQLNFDESKLPAGVSERAPGAEEPAPIEAFFRGKGLQRDGFTSDYISPAELQVTCAGPWCGSARSGIDAVYFVRADSNPVQMAAGACGGMIFEEPGQEVLDALTSCMQGGDCSAQPLQ